MALYDITIEYGFCSYVNTTDATDTATTNSPLTISVQGTKIKAVADAGESVFSFFLAQDEFKEINGVDVSGDTLAQIYTALQTAITPA
jgi:hypothetical protein